jgi:predicted dehydrogenase
MSDRILRWGILGAARITRSLVPAIRAAKGHELAATASRSADKARAHAEQWSIPRTFDSYEAMLADPDIDIVYIPLPNHLHAEWTIRAAEAGKHVLCEKPIALTVDDVDRMADAAKRAGVVIAEAFMYRHHAQTAKIQQLVQDGTLGDLKFIRGSFSFFLDRPGDVRRVPEFGGGSVWDIGCYPVSLARLVAGGEPTEVFGRAVIGPSGVDEVFAGQLSFPNGVLAQFDCSFAEPFRTEAEIVGSTGALRVTRPFKPGASETLTLTRNFEKVEQISVESNSAELYLGEVEDLGSAILHGTPTGMSLADSRANVAAIVALYESARTGKPISL